MTNTEIVIMHTALLIENGTIKPDNVINTFIGWKMKGYKIKRGAVHIAEFPIWVKTKTKKKPEPETEEQEATEPEKKKRQFVLQNAYWFTDEQVERI